MKPILLVAMLPLTLFSQESKLPPLKLGDEICITANNDSFAAHSVVGTRSLNDAPPLIEYPKENRPDISSFGVLDVEGKLQTISQNKGKIIVICFWTPSCDGSLRALQSMRFYQAEEKRGDFLVWPVHNEGWPYVLSFTRRKKDKFEGIRIFRSAIGENGMHVLGDKITALPMIYIVDRNGRLAASFSGYRQTLLSELLNKIYPAK
jgi:hypothetical protein